MAYFGCVDPSIYGIDYKILEPSTRATEVAVSVNYYQGYPYFFLKDRKLYYVPADHYAYLRKYPIRERIGYSIFIIEIP